MSAGSTPPRGHQGSVDDSGGNGGPIHPGFADTLAGLYAFGVSDSPATDNTLVGSYYDLFLNSEGGIAVSQIAATVGSDFDAHPIFAASRYFSTPGVLGMVEHYTGRYTTGGGTPSGGTFDRYSVDPDDAAAVDFMDYRRFLDFPSTLDWYSPHVTGATGAVSTVEWQAVDAVGGGHQSAFGHNSDGIIYNRALFPTTGGPFKQATHYDTMNRRDTSGAAPPNGSAIGWRIGGPDSGVGYGLSPEICSIYGFLDQQNFGSSQAVGHWEIWASGPTLADGPLKLATLAAGQSTFHVDLNTDGDLGADGNLDVIGTGTIGGTLDVTGQAIASVGLDQAFTADHVDFKVAAGGIAIIPNRPGYIFNFNRALIGYRTGSGTATGSLVLSIGNDAAEGNILGPQTVSAAAINTSLATGFLPFQGAFFGVGVVSAPMATGAATLKIRTAITGVTALTGWVTIFGSWITST